MARQFITPSFNKTGIAGPWFKTLESIVGGANYPQEMIYGWTFPTSVNKCILTGAYSPHMILRPAKETVSVKVNLWWWGLRGTSDWWNDIFGLTNPFIGWMMAVEQAKAEQMPYALVVNAIDSIDTMYLTRHSVDLDGNITWKWGQDSGAPDAIRLTYPYYQLAVGGENLVAQPTDQIHAYERGPDFDSGDLPKTFSEITGTTGMDGAGVIYKTPMRAITYKDDQLQTEENSFNDFSANLDNTSLGLVLYLWRIYNMIGADVSDQVYNGAFDMDGDGVADIDNCTANELFVGDDNPILLGIEVEIY